MIGMVQKPLEQVLGKLEELGFEAGWGKNAARIQDTMRLLMDILEVGSCVCNPTHSRDDRVLQMRTKIATNYRIRVHSDVKGRIAHGGDHVRGCTIPEGLLASFQRP